VMRPGCAHRPGPSGSKVMKMLRAFRSGSLLLGACIVVLAARPSHATMPPTSGVMPDELAQDFRDGLFALPPGPGALGVSAVRPVWRVPVLLVAFTDDTLKYSAPDFDFALFDTTDATPTGSAYDYYQWVSQGRLSLRGRVVGTVRLPHTRLWYGYNSWGLNRLSTPQNEAGMVRDALTLTDALGLVHWADFDGDQDGYVDMLWVAHTGLGGESGRSVNDPWSITSALNGQWNNSGPFEAAELIPGTGRHMRVDRFSCLPELSAIVPGARCEIGVYCHEFGHALGLPDLYNTADHSVRNSGPGAWSLMATGGNGGDGRSPQYPTRFGAWEMLFLGWAQSVRPAFDSTLVLPPIGATAPVLDLSFQGEPSAEHFLVENRRREGFDRNLPGEGLLVYHVDESVMGGGLQSNTVNAGFTPGLQVVEADGQHDLTQGIDRGGPGDPFPGIFDRTMLWDQSTDPSTRTFAGAATSLALFGITPQLGGVRVSAQVRAPGWQAPADRTEPGYEPVYFNTPAATTAIGPDGTLFRVVSQLLSGHAQVVLRSRAGNVWQPGFVVSHSAGNAIEPALALLPGGELAVAWSDSRSGATRLYFRARVGGVWTAEQLLVDLAGESRSPAIASDPWGALNLTWLSVEGNRPRLMFMRFSYLSPYGQPRALTAVGSIPTNPSIATDPDGGAYVMWSERSASPPALMFLHTRPDSTPGPAIRLGRSTALTQSSAQSQVDGNGTLHSVWLATGSGASEIHYQRRPATGPPSPIDTVLESRGGTIRDVRMALDPNGGIHVVFQNASGGVDEIRYKRRHPVRGWDALSTMVTQLTDGSSTSPALYPESPGNVTITYDGPALIGSRFFERRRLTDLPSALEAPELFPLPVRRLVLGPNPLRAGAALELSARADATLGGDAVDFFDLAGRRLATVTLDSGFPERRARLAGSVSSVWPAGVYFARLRAAGGPAARIVVLR
jgi:M6 family metalloprotease-like protein